MWYVQATIEKPEKWLVNELVVEVALHGIVGFIHKHDADHFVAENRAIELGEWMSADDLNEAVKNHQKAAHRAPVVDEAAEYATEGDHSEPDHATSDQPRRRGRPPKNPQVQ